MKKLNLIFLSLLIMASFILPSCKKKTECEKNGHSWIEATCEVAKKCSVCEITEGSALDHTWQAATTTNPKTCSRCSKTDGNPLPSVSSLNAYLSSDCISVGTSTFLNVDGFYDLTSFNLEYDNSIISIDDYGRITGLKVGTTNITISSKSNANKNKTVSIDVISEMPNIYTTLAKMRIGDVNNIYFKNLNNLSENSLNDFFVTFEKNILSLNAEGQLVANSLGIEKITVTSKSDERISASCTVEVVSPLSNTVINYSDASGIVEVGAQIKLTIDSFNTGEYVWSTGDDDIAVVTDRGYVTAKSEGTVAINAYAKDDPYNDAKKCSYYLTVSGGENVDYVANLIYTALREYGTEEGPNNDQKYGYWYGFNYNAWCAMFVSWSMYHSGQNSDVFIKYMNCRVGLAYAAENNMAHFMQDYTFDEPLEDGRQHFTKEAYTPKSGDIIMLFDVGHTGIVIYVDDTYVYTVEGNSSNMVAVRRYTLDSSNISAYISPNYPECKNPEDFSWIKNPKEDGYYWWENCGDPNEIL